MENRSCKIITGVAFIIRNKNNQILLFKRNIPGKIAFGSYALPGGTIENHETVKQTVCREAQEEIGISIKQEDISIVHVLRLREKVDPITHKTDQILILYFAEIMRWAGQPINKEPHKHSALGWFDSSTLPDKLFPLNRQALQNIHEGIFYSEHGW